MKSAARGIDGEGVHRGQHARAHQEGADQADSEKVRMASRMVQLFSASRFSTTIAECKQRGADAATA